MPGCERPCNKTPELHFGHSYPELKTHICKEDKKKAQKKGMKLGSDRSHFFKEQIGAEGKCEGRQRLCCETRRVVGAGGESTAGEWVPGV